MPLTFDENGALLIRDTGNNTFIGLGDTPAAYAGNANRVLVVNAVPDAVAFASNLYWDEVNDRLGILTATPGTELDVNGTVTIRANSSIIKDLNTGATVISGGTASNIGANIALGGNAHATLADVVRFRASNTETVRISSSGYVGINDASPTRRLQAVDSSASTNTIIPISRIESQVSGGAGAAGHGPGFEYTGETTTTEDTLMSVTAARWSVATHASRRSRFEIRNYYIGNEVLCGVIEAPANASVDGNARGVGAVDLQGYRSGASQVPAGLYSVIVGGQRSEIGSGDGAAIVGGYDHSIGSNASQAGILGGYDHLIDGAEYSGILAGREAHLTNYGQIARASGQFSTQGDAQGSDYMARRDVTTHTDTTWYSLWLDGASEQMVIQPSSAWTVIVEITGITANAAEQWSYILYGLIERDNANNTTMAAQATWVTIFESDAAYEAQLVADDANEALEVQVRRNGGADYSIQWVASIHTTECIHT